MLNIQSIIVYINKHFILKWDKLILFFLAFIIRLVFAWAMDFDGFRLQSDVSWYVRLAEETLNGYVNYDIGRFIAAPAYPFFFGELHVVFWQLLAIFGIGV
jgi:hypothetical protein